MREFFKVVAAVLGLIVALPLCIMLVFTILSYAVAYPVCKDEADEKYDVKFSVMGGCKLVLRK